MIYFIAPNIFSMSQTIFSIHIMIYKPYKELIMNNCTDLYFLSTVACQISECLSKDDLELLAADLKVLGEMLEAISVQQSACKKSMQ